MRLFLISEATPQLLDTVPELRTKQLAYIDLIYERFGGVAAIWVLRLINLDKIDINNSSRLTSALNGWSSRSFQKNPLTSKLSGYNSLEELEDALAKSKATVEPENITPDTAEPENTKPEGTNQSQHPEHGPDHIKLKAIFDSSLRELERKDPQKAKKYRDEIHYVIGNMSQQAIRITSENVYDVKWHDSIDSVSAVVRNLIIGRIPPEDAKRVHGKTFGGAYDAKYKHLYLDGGWTEKDIYNALGSARQIYAHELAHSLDRGYSKSPEWLRAYEAEITNGSLSQYAVTGGTAEGWAEFGRLAILEPKRAKELFPKCWAVWHKHKLV